MPESLTTLRLIKSEKLNATVAFKRSGGIPLHPSFTFLLSIIMFFKEDVTPAMVKQPIYTVAPLVAVVARGA